MEKKGKNKKRRRIITIIIIIIIIIILLLLKACGNGKDEPITSYAIKFVNIDGTVLQEENVNINEIPVYHGEEPTYSDDEYIYTFIGWDKNLVKVESDATYTAIYEKESKTVETVKIDPEVKAPVEVIGMVYNGTARKPVIKGTTTGGTLCYALGTSKKATTTYTNEIPYVTNAGTYYVWYKVIGNSEYNSTEPNVIIVEVSKRDIELGIPSTPTVESNLASSIMSKTKITLNQNPETDWEIEYGISETNTEPTTWQSTLTFDELSPNKTYYFFSRYKGNDNYNAGEVSSSLEVTTCKANRLAPSSPTVSSNVVSSTASKTKITINKNPETDGEIEYGISETNAAPSTWQSTLTFDELSPNTTYYIFSRYKEDENYNTSEASSALEVTTCKANRLDSSVPTILVDSISASETVLYTKATVKVTNNLESSSEIEYGISKTNTAPSTWQSSLTFDNLSPVTTYYVFARYKEDASYNTGKASAGLELTTCKANQPAPSKPSITGSTYNTSTSVYTYTIDNSISTGHGDIQFKYYDDEGTTKDWSTTNTCGVKEDPGMNVYIVSRFKGDDKYNQSPESEILELEDLKIDSNCLAKGTKITMADYTTKNIEDIKVGDLVLTYNHEEGKYEGQKVYLNWVGEVKAKAFTLNFTNDIHLSIITDHSLFEKESLSYVAIFEYNAESFIGKHFYNAIDNRYEELLSVTYETVETEYYEIYTEYNANSVANSMLNVACDVSDFLNIYKFNEDLTIDHDALNKDIEEFGLYEYKENDRYSREFHESQRWQYTNILVGKGYGTWDIYNQIREDVLNTYF